MCQFIDRASEAGVRLINSDGLRLAKMCGCRGPWGVVACVDEQILVKSRDELLERVEAAGTAQPLLHAR